MSVPTLLVALLLGAGLALLLRAMVHVRRRRIGRASRSGLGAGTCLALGGLGLALVVNLYTYQRLTYERPVATLSCQGRGDHGYVVRLEQPDGRSRRFRVVGTSWQLSARVLKWRPWANLLGLDARYRLDRLSGRYRRVDRARRAPRTVHQLSGNGSGLDAWAAAHWLNAWLPVLDTRYGSAVYMPMADGADYKVALTQTGLVARPANATARRIIRSWSG